MLEMLVRNRHSAQTGQCPGCTAKRVVTQFKDILKIYFSLIFPVRYIYVINYSLSLSEFGMKYMCWDVVGWSMMEAKYDAVASS